MIFRKKEKEEFMGIIMHKTNTSPNEITITSSSVCLSNEQTQNVILFDNQSKYYMSNCITYRWICFDFQNNRVAPTDYRIRSPIGWGDNSPEPQNWVIEGSNDNSSWDLLSEEKYCSIIHGKGKIHTFNIHNQTSKEYRYI